MLNRVKEKIKIRHRLSVMGILCLLIIYASAQTYVSERRKEYFLADNYDYNALALKTDTIKKAAKGGTKGEPKLVNIVRANTYSKAAGRDYSVLRNDVVLLHDGAYLYCDSAYVNELTNSFEAFSNVRMEQGDTLFLYGDWMHYNGNSQLVRIRDNVRMDHRSGTLFTDSLNYDRIKNIGYYFDGGMLVDTLNELTSVWGQYEPSKNLATFKEEVVLTNPNYKLYSDTLLYSTDTRIATIVSPSRIVSDSGTIHTSRGWYNTLSEESLLLDQSLVVNKEGNRTLQGDSILFHRYNNTGEVFGNMNLQDTLKKVILRGDYGYYNGTTDYAYAHDSASVIEYSQKDSLFLHADTLELTKLPPVKITTLITKRDTLKYKDENENLIDSIVVRTDTINEIQEHHRIKAYYGVRFFRSDLQGVCDSLQFVSSDSVLHMYKEPVLWNLERQLTGDTINVIMNDSTIDRMHIINRAFSIEKKDSLHYNQLKSKFLNSYFHNGQLKKVFADGNVETIAYPEEKDGALNELLNWLTSSYLEIHLLEGQFEKLVAWPAPVGKTTPFHLVKPEQLRLADFFWYDYLRPLDKDDIFRKVKRKESDVRKERPTIFDREQ